MAICSSRQQGPRQAVVTNADEVSQTGSRSIAVLAEQHDVLRQ
jgi:hypothetical protein